ncbi:mesenchyme-specific cell surface glycoprotein-like [Pecten maximus]|uniref:mesenchyme-specific cell surface glycoprotein-like n=1 Tax=Pecten maximus TaxID=6579 RepID=UPI001458AE25|nr:mesenchyme-specific cell surface glycoprotein-like [Pecten maximus]
MMRNDEAGRVEIYRIEHATTETHVLVHNITVGVRPDMILSTSDCRTVVVSLEGNPYNNGSHFVDPEGAVGIIRFTDASGIAGQYQYTELDFTKFNNQWQNLVSSGVRFVYRDNNKFSNDLEPEYIAFNNDESIAYICLQENNAVAVLNLSIPDITAIHPLGYKNWTNSKLDVSDKDGSINIRSWPVMGMYQPDAIKVVMIKGKSYLLTANEGSTKDYSDIAGSGGFNEESRVAELTIDDHIDASALVPYWASQNGFLWNLQTNKNLGRLEVSNLEGKHGDAYDDLYTFGGRSISLYDLSNFNQVYDSGSEVEEMIAQHRSDLFNANGKSKTTVVSASKDSRSDARGPEIESLAVLEDGNTTVIFAGIERPGLIAVYSVTGDVNSVQFESLWSGITRTDDTFENLYNQRLISDVGPDDLRYIPAHESPNNMPLLLSTASGSGTVSVLQIKGLSGSGSSGSAK